MAQYRLTTEHYWYDQILPEGTVVGDGTAFALPMCKYVKGGKTIIEPSKPSMFMEPLDDEARATYTTRMDPLGGEIPVDAMAHPKAVPAGMDAPGQGPKAKTGPELALNLPGQGPRTATGHVAPKGQ